MPKSGASAALAPLSFGNAEVVDAAARDPAKRSDLELPAVAFLVQFDQDVIGRIGAVWNVEIERGAVLSNEIPGSRPF